MFHPAIWRKGRFMASSTWMPRERTSASTRSRNDVMSWSRRLGASSRRNSSARTKTDRPTAPATRNWNCQSWASTVWEATRETVRLPSTGPSVQKPMAAPRRCWGEKSRTSAGVATSTMPSKKPTVATARA